MARSRIAGERIPRDAHHVVLVSYAVAALVPIALLLLLLVGSLLLSGAQVLPDAEPRYDAPVPFPIFVVADWLVIALAVLGALLVVPLVVTTTVVQAGQLIGTAAWTFGAGLASVVFAFAFPAAGSPFPSPNDPDGFLGWHLLASIILAGCVVVVLVRLAMVGPRHERLRKAGELPNGQW